MMKRIVPCVLLGLIFVALTGCAPQGPSDAPSVSTEPRTTTEEIVIRDLKSPGEIRLASFSGQVVLLDFWATWCPPCRHELPILNRLHEELNPRGFSMIGMTVDRGDFEKIATAVRDFGLVYPVGLAEEDVQKAFGGIRAVPTKFLLDRKGNVVKSYVGVVPGEEIRADIEALLAG